MESQTINQSIGRGKETRGIEASRNKARRRRRGNSPTATPKPTQRFK